MGNVYWGWKGIWKNFCVNWRFNFKIDSCKGPDTLKIEIQGDELSFPFSNLPKVAHYPKKFPLRSPFPQKTQKISFPYTKKERRLFIEH